MNNVLPKISVVTPSYNQGKFLEKTIISVLTQEYPDFEYIVLDGGSKDASPQIIKKYSDHLSFWRSAPDEGQAAAIAEGFAMAKGEILCWVNSDDLLLPGALLHVGRLFMNYGDKLQWLIGGTIDIDENDCILRYRKALPVCFDAMISVGCVFAQPSAFWRKSFYEKVKGFDTKLQLCFDQDLFLRFCHLQKPKSTSRNLSAFRVHAESKTSSLQHIGKKEMELVNGQWNRKVSSLRRNFFFVCQVIWGKLAYRYPKRKTALELSQLIIKQEKT